MPASSIFDFRFGERDLEHARVDLGLKPQYLQGEARVHGGILATLADTCAVYLAVPRVPVERMLTSIEFKLNFVRPALLERGDVSAHATMVRFGRQVVLIDVELSQSHGLIAKGLFTYLQVDRGTDETRATASKSTTHT